MKNSIIDLSSVPAPKIIEELDANTLFEEILEEFKTNYPEFSALVESDPVYKLMESFAYREMILRQKINDGAKAVMIAYASGTDLDGLAANFDIERHQISEADSENDAAYESDDWLRRRILLAMDALGAAGATNAYIYHALSAHPNIRDASVITPSPGEIEIHVWANTESNIPTEEELQAVRNTVTAEHVRPLTDLVTVKPCTTTEVNITATIETDGTVGESEVIDAALYSLQCLINNHAVLGMNIPQSALYAALHVPQAVTSAVITQPSNGIKLLASQAPAIINITVNGETNNITTITPAVELPPPILIHPPTDFGDFDNSGDYEFEEDQW